MIGDMAKTLEDTMAGKQPGKAAPPAPVYRTPTAPAYTEGSSGSEGETSPGSTAYRQTPYIVGGETAASPYSLNGEGISRQPQEPLPTWRGSLPSTEGTVAFTAKMNDTYLTPGPYQEAHPALNLSFNRDSLMQAVIMHEILTRPQDRRRRWKPY